MQTLFNDWKKVRIIENEKRRVKDIKFNATFWRYFRIVVQIFISISVLITAMCSKVSLFYITNGIFKSENQSERHVWVWLLIITCCVPNVFAFLDCFFKSLFDPHEQWPSFKIFVLIFITETFNIAGTTLFAFRVLPRLDIIQALLLMNTFSIIPSLLNLFIRNTTSVTNKFGVIVSNWLNGNNSIKIKFEIAFNLIAFLILASTFVIIFLPILTVNKTWDLCLSIIFISISYWENFFHSDLIFISKTKNQLLNNFKKSIEYSRHRTLLFIILWKILFIFLIAYLLHPLIFTDIGLLFSDDNQSHYISIILNIISSFFCYYFSLLACKLCMQRTSFSLPLLFNFPILFSIILLLCTYLPKESVLKEYFLIWTCYSNYTSGSFKWIILCGILWWLAHLWVNRHVWINVTKRSEQKKRLFVTPGYSNVFIDQHLLMSRKRVLFEEEEIFDLNKVPNRVMLYSCATMWHENDHETLKLLTSIMRLDKDQKERQRLQEAAETNDPDYYDYEGHIFFDDAMITSDNGDVTLNSFVETLLNVVNEAASFCYERKMVVDPPQKFETLYGGRLIYTLPAGNKLIVHLKDKNKIRIKKRWSQVMYMFYLLGFTNFDNFDEMLKLYEDCDEISTSSNKNGFTGFGNLLRRMDPVTRKKLENTFLLTLDGDVEFRPDAVRLMVDKMKKHKKVGSVCGRVHPIGSGPIIWYQVFEYAVGHWLQKASEHLFGTVMCSPGCFSLLRGSAVVDDHVLRTYATRSTEASHYVQYDQGEDRWLSTLLIQQGYCIQYCSAAVSYTYAPETFHEYYSQRRRWIPSTIANLLDFLKDFKHILRTNTKISLPYVIYEFLMLIGSILGPSTILLLLADTYQFSFGADIYTAYFFSIAPTVIFILFCTFAKNDTQILVAIILSSIFALIMVAAIVVTVTRLANTLTLLNPSTAVLMMLFIVYFTAAILHPREFLCLIPGVLYFLCLPSTFVLLQIYALFNLNNVSWGTREIKTHQPGDHNIKNEQLSSMNKLGNIFKKILKTNSYKNSLNHQIEKMQPKQKSYSSIELIDDGVIEKVPINWMDHPLLANSQMGTITDKENKFFDVLIKTYLSPIVYDEVHKNKITDDLKTLKNNCSFSFCMVNAIWLSLIFNLQLIKTQVYKALFIEIPVVNDGEYIRYEPLSFIFVILFILMTILQYVAMLWHRYKTLLHMVLTAAIPRKILKKRKNSVIEGNKYGSIVNGAEIASSNATTSTVI